MNKPRTILITGAAGFVGAHMVEHLLKNTQDNIIGLDCLNYSGTWDRLRDVSIKLSGKEIQQGMNDGYYESTTDVYSHPRFKSVTYNFVQPFEKNHIRELRDVTHILHMGAESHVDGSIADPTKFLMSNTLGTLNVLQLARELPNLELFLYFSTDEVFGPAPMELKGDPIGVGKELWAPEGSPNGTHNRVFRRGYSENDRHDPKNPYAASKSAAEQFVVSFANTYGLPCVITRQMNIFGERQHPEKFIPLCIKRAIEGGEIQVHGTPDLRQAGLRHYIHARNVADAHLFLLNAKPWAYRMVLKDVPSYHIVGEAEVDNMTLAKTINEYTGILGEQMKIHCVGATFKMINFHESRPGHDLRYALDGSKMSGLGWKPPKTFHESMKQNIKWYLENMNWLE